MFWYGNNNFEENVEGYLNKLPLFNKVWLLEEKIYIFYVAKTLTILVKFFIVLNTQRNLMCETENNENENKWPHTTK